MKKVPALFFDERGYGPTESDLWVERHDPRKPEEGDRLYFGLRVATGPFGGEKRDAGGFMLAPDTAAALHQQLGDALGASEAREVVRAVADAALASRRARDARNQGLRDDTTEEAFADLIVARDRARDALDAALDAYESALADGGSSGGKTGG